MGRVLLLAPLIFILIYIYSKEEIIDDNSSSTQKAKVTFPSFILWFLFFVVLASFEVLPKSLEHIISSASHYISLIAMSAIGLMINFSNIKQSASKAFVVSSILFAMQLIFSAVLLKLL
jgi:uncharacterized membrane protein YadS